MVRRIQGAHTPDGGYNKESGAMKHLATSLSVVVLSACGGTTVPIDVVTARPAELISVSEFPVISSTVPRNFDPAGPVTSRRDAQFAEILNDYRISDAVGTLAYNDALDTAAQKHAQDMLARDYLSHTSPEGDTVRERIIAQGYAPTAYAENLAQGQQSDASVLRDWQNSPSHDEALRAASLKEFGLGVAGAGGQTRWVLVMGAQ